MSSLLSSGSLMEGGSCKPYLLPVFDGVEETLLLQLSYGLHTESSFTEPLSAPQLNLSNVYFDSFVFLFYVLKGVKSRC